MPVAFADGGVESRTHAPPHCGTGNPNAGLPRRLRNCSLENANLTPWRTRARTDNALHGHTADNFYNTSHAGWPLRPQTSPSATVGQGEYVSTALEEINPTPLSTTPAYGL